jgi:hypothetical protein
MVKIISGILVGIFAALLAVYFGFLFIAGQKDGSSPLLLVPSVFLILVGGYSFFKVFKVITAPKTTNSIDALALEAVSSDGTDTSVLQRNNSLIADYKKTTETQDKLKMLQAAGTINEG